MALNSNLRCSKLGDEGRSVNVVSAELRVFAEKLEEPANNVVEELQHFESAAEAFSQCAEATNGDLSGPLREALDDIRAMSKRMDESIAEFEHEGQEVFAKGQRRAVHARFRKRTRRRAQGLRRSSPAISARRPKAMSPSSARPPTP
jgi:hypothetical protein